MVLFPLPTIQDEPIAISTDEIRYLKVRSPIYRHGTAICTSHWTKRGSKEKNAAFEKNW